ncbi:MAG: hypothetical protein NWF05_11835 [Candidatus Bathyarchaeota archaeon]|nr:hypothetical protein [Candidatus Bathyarchaeota archaeon]
MTDFLVNFLAEIGLGIGITSLTMFQFGQRSKWKPFAIIFLLLLSPFYINQGLPSWVIIAWLAIIAVGTFFLVRITIGSAYHLALFGKASKENKRKEPAKDALSKTVKKLENYILFILLPVGLLVVVVMLKSPFEILQVPLLAVGLICLMAIFFCFIMGDKETLNKKLKLNLTVFLVLTYFVMGYLFVDLFYFFYAYLSSSIHHSAIFSTIILGALFVLIEQMLLKVKKDIPSLVKNHTLAETFSRLFKVNIVTNVLLMVFLSDIPLVYSMFVEQNIQLMIMWTFPFIAFLSYQSMKALRIDLEFQLQMGLAQREELEDKLKKLS